MSYEKVFFYHVDCSNLWLNFDLKIFSKIFTQFIVLFRLRLYGTSLLEYIA